MIPDLFPIRGHNSFCGPAVIATITGKSTDEAAFLLRMATGRARITKTRVPEVLEVLRSLSYYVAPYQAYDLRLDGPNLLDWLTLHKSPWLGVSLVATEGHWQVIDGDWLACSTFRDPILWRDIRKRYLKERVKYVWAVIARSIDPADSSAYSEQDDREDEPGAEY